MRAARSASNRPTALLRQFLYCDAVAVREFLAQLEGGVYEVDSRMTRSDASGRVGGSIGPAIASVGAERGSVRAEESQRQLQQTAASEFERLYQQLQQQDYFTFVDGSDETWITMERGQIVEVDTVIRLGGIRKLLRLGEAMERASNLMTSIGSTVDPRLQATLGTLRQMRALDDDAAVPIVASVAGSPRHQFAAELLATALHVGEDRLEGEATLLAKVQRKLRRGERHLELGGVTDLMAAVGARARADFGKIFADPKAKAFGLDDPSVGYPGVIVTPIAIYR